MDDYGAAPFVQALQLPVQPQVEVDETMRLIEIEELDAAG